MILCKLCGQRHPAELRCMDGVQASEPVTARRPSWTGIDEPAKIGHHWVPYVLPHGVGRRTGLMQALPPIKVDMRGLKLITKHMAIMWMNEGIKITHPGLVGSHIEIVEEPSN